MKAEAVRDSSRVKDAADRRVQGTVVHGGERRESKPGSGSDSAPARDRRDSRWDEHRRARRRELVDAALTAVGRHGAGVGMDEIAAAAGTSKTAVYRHFADRGELHTAVCTRVAEQLTATLRAAMESSDSRRGMLAAAIDAYLAFLEADPEVYRFVVHTHPAGAADGDPITTLSDLVGDQAAALVGAALRGTGADDTPAPPWGHGVVGLVRSAADWWLRADRPMPRGDLAAHLTDLAWAGLSGVVAVASEDAVPTNQGAIEDEATNSEKESVP
jgi:AcrR family transcriptional regulator